MRGTFPRETHYVGNEQTKNKIIHKGIVFVLFKNIYYVL